MTFLHSFDTYKRDSISSLIYSKTEYDVKRALTKSGSLTLDDFAALISPAAETKLEEMAAQSQRLTKQRFGNTIQMYIPLYLSNECQNICTYCGFSYNNKIPRLTLNDTQVLNEVEAIKKLGFDHILLLTGEAQKTVGMPYFERILKLIRPYFSHISMEVQPLDEDEYSRLIDLGLHTVLVYQETYDRDVYKEFHPKGRKSNFDYRLETPDRLGKAGIYKMGIGALLGLSDFRIESYLVASHLQYLEQTYWRSKFSISFPRLRPAEGVIKPRVHVTDRNLVQLITAYRIFNHNVELSLSTRESSTFRDQVLKLGITSMSAGSRTDPGGYAADKGALKQFEISDERSPSEVAAAIRTQGYEAVWKDWMSL